MDEVTVCIIFKKKKKKIFFKAEKFDDSSKKVAIYTANRQFITRSTNAEGEGWKNN